MNKVILIGRLTKDPQLNFIPGSGKAIVKFTLAVERSYQKDGKKEADFINCTAFDKRAEAIANYVQKGHLFGISGRLQISSYDKDGERKYSTDIIVDEFQFLQSKNTLGSEGSINKTEDEDLIEVLDDGDIPF
ncbi:single-stranded DNA-binding protein [Clostridium algidicarnis]|uniref:single-stranded DNA-binding protein n=1 Tax=Clostridium algidicarnis TaxID=37659 RepID=UPI001C0BAF41|nr:single-stranded DNA-binding protein [Clostridium algidicarnis]MBU3193488.1 single-stranded DNA-binding protein [Clostridium algidicarnis]MBU3203106.1 single-stranded DNA-binding protein [Clostridium algidicarnis]MBU3205596.1 single-stranded DNA-binding protein [Clostridium algidicarnis]MBU3208710.1 single-stranded DNA-binding protein [Clostridium algidicarnis]MBU3211260.1 single-stranded DNA-binding protein [Clostridium algidicarnis]